MSETKYEIKRDSHNRLCAEISESVTVGVKILSVTDERRQEKNTHAYIVLDVRTELGPLRIRDIRVMWSQENERYFLRWHQWPTGHQRDGRKEYLDVAGPLERDTRSKFEEALLAVFQQVREEAEQGTLGRNPETRKLLEEAKQQLEAD
jgi:DNA-binding cell septation regulator SpoVG